MLTDRVFYSDLTPDKMFALGVINENLVIDFDENIPLPYCNR